MTSLADSIPHDSTDRLDLYRPTPQDLPGLHAIVSDPRVWEHYPSLRSAELSQTETRLERWMRGWETDGIGSWIARERGRDAIVGHGGLNLIDGVVWNLGYRFAPEVQGRGLATELARRALERARSLDDGRPVVAYLLEHNVASGAVAQKLGLRLVDRGPDAGNPDPSAVRLIYSTRALTPGELAAARA